MILTCSYLKSGKCFTKQSSSDLSFGFKHKNILRFDCEFVLVQKLGLSSSIPRLKQSLDEKSRHLSRAPGWDPTSASLRDAQSGYHEFSV